jgi:beta-galactosidase
MKKIMNGMLIFCLLISMLFASHDRIITDKLIDVIADQMLVKEKAIDGKLPEYTLDGEWQFRDKVNWFSGMTAGEHFALFEISAKDKFKAYGLNYADALIPFANIDYTHDMGFIFMPSVVEAFKLTGEKKYREAGLIAAGMLAKRFNKNAAMIRAWGKLGSPNKAGWMIIDTMMNLDLLFWASQESGDPSYYSTAYQHALTAMNTLIRPNGGSWHVAEFDPETGKLEKRRTHQGYSDESTWARGQAWGICGFAPAYKYTEDARFYAVSKKMARYFIERLPEDMIPSWDLDLAGQDVLRDASAAAVAALGLFELADLTDSKEDHDYFLENALKMTRSLLENYLFTTSDRKHEEGLLLHTIYHYHKKWGVDESFPAGDYYLTQALKKLYEYERETYFIEDNSERREYCLNTDWDYLEEDLSDPGHLYMATEDWQVIDLPHTWNTTDVMDAEPGYRRDGSWYEKCIYLPEYADDKRLVLSFEGVNTYAKVYVNGQEVGEHIGGYLAFDVDMTDHVKLGEKNKIQVYASNAINMDIVPSQKSDFFIYGGITRDVHLKVLPGIYLDKVNVQTPDVSKTSASTIVMVGIVNHEKAKKVDLTIDIKDKSGKVVSKVKKKIELQADKSVHNIELPEISDPDLWSPDDPTRYSIEVKLNAGKNTKDKICDKIGYRWFEFEKSGPFYLNGERLLIRGTHRHEEHAGVGAAMSNEMHRADMEMIKEMGGNFVRLAHYPQDPEIYKACDELGLLVWDEVPWCRGGMGEEVWQNNTLNMLDEMILQNMNHPSIIVWSLGNELYWMPDFPNGGDDDRLRAFLEIMNDRAHELDPTRVTAMRKYYAGADIVDVFSPSIWAGWYSGVYTNFEKALKNNLKKYPYLLHMEYGGSSHVGRHDENPVDGKGWQNTEGWEEAVNQVQVKNIARTGDWSENYIVDLFDWHLHVSEQLDWFTGNAQWAVKDFGTPLRPENSIPYVNQKGLFDRNGKPKDAYYVFKSYWTRGEEHEPFVYIESPTWTERQGPEGTIRNLSIFSNCDEVKLTFNGKDMGKKEWDINNFPACGLNWDLEFQEGENILVATAFRNEKEVANHELSLHYRYEKNQKPERFYITNQKQEDGMVLVTVTARDKDGLRCLDYDELVYFYHSGDGKLLLDQGTPNASSIIEMANGQASILLKPVPGGSCVIEARNQDFKGDYLTINF